MDKIRPEQTISSIMPASVATILHSRGIDTIGALMETDAYKAIVSGRYDIDRVLEVNGIPVSAFKCLTA